MLQVSAVQKVRFSAICSVVVGAMILAASTGVAQNAETETNPSTAIVNTADSQNCAGTSGEKYLAVVSTVQRSQYLLTNNIPSDQMQRCGGRLVGVGLRQDGIDEQVKTSSFTAETKTDVRTMEASVSGGGDTLRYALFFEHVVSESTSDLQISGAGNDKETLSGVQQSARIEAGTKLGSLTAGLLLRYLSSKSSRETPVAGTVVSTSGKRLNVIQPGISLALQIDQTQVTVLRNQATEDSSDADRLKQPWTSAVRVVQLLEQQQQQGIRGQLERSGSSEPESTATNAGLIAYFLAIDNVTVDVGWFGRSSSYNVKEEATANQLTTFGLGASTVWHYSPTADVYGSLHSLSANEALGGSEKRTAHRLITGGNLGVQVAF